MATTLIISLWTLAVILIVVGVAGTVLPALPGVVFVFLGIFLAAWIDDFTTVSGLTVGICLAFTLLAIGLDYVAGMLGAKKVGASREAIVGHWPVQVRPRPDPCPQRRHRHLAGHGDRHADQDRHHLPDDRDIRVCADDAVRVIAIRQSWMADQATSIWRIAQLG